MVDFNKLMKPGSCSSRQREEIERRGTANRLNWAGILEVCSEVTGRTIKDTGELSMSEASNVIDKLGDE